MTIGKWLWVMLAMVVMTARSSGQTATEPPATRPEAEAGGESGEGRTAAPAAPPARAGHETNAPPANLRAAMNDMLDVVYNLKNEFADPGNMDLTLRDLATFQRDVAVCKLHAPPAIGRLSGEERADELNSYRIMMSNLMRTSLDLEDAVTEKNVEQAKKLIAQIEEIENDGHQEFVPP